MAGDLFSDTDLKAICAATRVEDYPNGLERISRESSPANWMYTGALENYPDLVDRISANRRLLGIGGKALRDVRNPAQVSSAFRSDGLRCPDVRLGDSSPKHKAWLKKPLRSAGGAKIEFFDVNQPDQQVDSSAYFQQSIEGRPASAVYVAANQSATLLGSTAQLVGTSWLCERPFAYCGSIGPLDLSREMRDSFRRIGNCLAKSFNLTGLFGVDVVIRGDEVWPVEVNPRYTASVEVLEWALHFDSIALHVGAYRDGQIPETITTTASGPCWGKAIKFASSTVSMSNEAFDLCWQDDAKFFADIPAAGTLIERGNPIATAITSGRNPDEVTTRLMQLWGDLEACLYAE